MSGTGDGGGDPRRYLIATAVSHYPNAPADLEWDRPGLTEARRKVVELFTGELGYEHVSELGANPTQHQLLKELRDFCISADRRPDDVLAVYIAGHGDVLPNGDYVLLTADTHPDDLYDALLPATLARKILAGTKVRRLLLMLDTCFSGQGGNELLAAMARLKSDWREEGTGLAVVTSAQPRELALTGAFPELLAEAVTSLATAGYAPPLLALDAVVNATRANPERPDFQHIGLEIIGLTGETPPFLPNAKHSPRLSHTDLALQQAEEWNEQDRRRDEAFRTHLLRRAMGHRDRDRMGWWFSGRHRALENITEWLGELPEDRPALVVTGDPGSGKTAVLGLLAAVSDPEYRRTVPLSSLGLAYDRLPRRRAIRAALYAQNLTDQQVVRALAAALRLPPSESVADLLNHLTARPAPDRPQAVLIDGLDEAVTPESLCGQVLRPLRELGRPYLRLLLGTRPHLFKPLGLRRSEHVDLDAPCYADPEAVLAYTIRNLLDAQPDSPYLWCDSGHRLAVARAVAEAAGHSFLVARITAGTLAAASGLPDPLDAGWRRSLPSAAADAMHRDLHQRFGDRAGTILDLLRPLAYAEGQGLPWEDIWAPLASELAGHDYTNRDLHRLRRDAGAYVVEAAEDGRSVYRLYHEAMAEYLRQDQDARAAHRAFATALRRTVPYRLDGRRDWARAHPYLRRHLATHAARGGVLDDLVTDTEYLSHADCDTLVTCLEEVEGDTARLHAAVFRASIDVHRPLDADARRRILALDAARYNEPSLVEALNSSAPGAGWHPVAASGSLLTGNVRNVLTGHSGAVGAVACTVLNNRTVAVTGSEDNTVRIWDLTTGQPVGHPLTGHTDTVETVACTHLNGHPAAVTGSKDNTVRIWDLTTGLPVGRPMAVSGHRMTLVVAPLDDHPVAVTSSIGSEPCVWDLTTQQQRGRLQGEEDIWITAMACTELDDRTVVVGCVYGGEPRIWDPESRRELATLACEGDGGYVRTVACSEVEGRPVLLASYPTQQVKVLDLKHGRQVGSLEGSATSMSLACALLAGRPIAVGGSGDTVRVWEVSVRPGLGRPVTGHTQWISAMDLAHVGGRQVLVTGSFDRTVRKWDPHTCLPVGEPLTTHAESVFSVACSVLKGRPVVLTSTALGPAVRVWDMETWQEAGPQLDGPTEPVSEMTCAFLHDRPLVIGYALDKTVRVWDLETGRSLCPPLRVGGPEVVRTAATLLDGRPVAVISADDTTRVWDLSDHRRLAEIDQGARAVACGELGDRPVLVTCARDGAVHVWDLVTGQPLGRPMTGHSAPPSSVRCAVLDGRSVAVTSSLDHTVRIWDLATGAAVSVIHVPRPSRALLVEDGGLLVCNFGSDLAVLRRARPDAHD